MLKDSQLSNAISIIKNEGIVVHPTDTIYGLACDILSEKAVERIYALKKRKRDLPLLLLVDSIEMLKQYVTNLHPRIETLLVYHTRPLTLIYKASSAVPDYLVSSQNTIGIRLVHEDLCKSLINGIGRPITSTSANISGQPFPIFESDLSEHIRQGADIVLPQTSIGSSSNQPSIVAQFNSLGELEILRS